MKPKVTILPPGPEDPALRFQPYQWDPVLGDLAAKGRLSAQAIKTIFRDVTLAGEVASILRTARTALLRCQDEQDTAD